MAHGAENPMSPTRQLNQQGLILGSFLVLRLLEPPLRSTAPSC